MKIRKVLGYYQKRRLIRILTEEINNIAKVYNAEGKKSRRKEYKYFIPPGFNKSIIGMLEEFL